MGELFDLLASRTYFMHFCAVFNSLWSQLETDSDVISGRFVRLIASINVYNVITTMVIRPLDDPT